MTLLNPVSSPAVTKFNAHCHFTPGSVRSSPPGTITGMSITGTGSAPRKFAHLHQHTDYSLLDGAARIKELIRWVKEVKTDEQDVAVTVHVNMLVEVPVI